MNTGLLRSVFPTSLLLEHFYVQGLLPGGGKDCAGEEELAVFFGIVSEWLTRPVKRDDVPLFAFRWMASYISYTSPARPAQDFSVVQAATHWR